LKDLQECCAIENEALGGYCDVLAYEFVCQLFIGRNVAGTERGSLTTEEGYSIFASIGLKIKNLNAIFAGFAETFMFFLQ
jgi:hypothetical protein